MAKVEMPESSLNYPGNSNQGKRDKEAALAKPKPKKVVQGKVIVKKPSFGRKFADVFFGEEVVDVKGYILQDVLVPSIKDMISDIISGGIDMLLFGEHRYRNGRSRPNSSYTSYGSYYNGGRQTQSKPRSGGGYTGSRYYVKDIIFESRGEAENVLGEMLDIIKDYGMVSVNELYEIAEVREPGQFTDASWGWFDLGSSNVRRVREGYMLVLPKAVSLK